MTFFISAPFMASIMYQRNNHSNQHTKETLICILSHLLYYCIPQIPDNASVTVECAELELLNPTPYRNKEHCCREAEHHTLPELCGEHSGFSIKNESHVEGCTCVDFMACKTVVLTATSENHWVESLDALASVQSMMPDMKIIMLDLGMNAEQVEQLELLRNVEIQTFPFDKFPPHVRRLEVFAWKSLSMQMTLAKHEVVFYMDASIRLRRPLVDILIPSVQDFPIKVNTNRMYDGAFTQEEMYNYLGVSRKEVSKRRQREGGLQMYRNCSFLHKRILSSLVDCALHEECIAPSGASPYGCDMDKYREQMHKIDTIEQFEYIGCHRFDQSAMTSVLEREFQFADQHPVVSPAAFQQSLVVWRYPTNCFTLFLKDSN